MIKKLMANIKSTGNSAHFNNRIKTYTCLHLERKMDVRHDFHHDYFSRNRSSPPGVFFGKTVLKICSNFIRVHLCRSAISIKLQSKFIKIALKHGCSLVNWLHIFRKNLFLGTLGELLLEKGLILGITWGFSDFIF